METEAFPLLSGFMGSCILLSPMLSDIKFNFSGERTYSEALISSMEKTWFVTREVTRLLSSSNGAWAFLVSFRVQRCAMAVFLMRVFVGRVSEAEWIHLIIQS